MMIELADPHPVFGTATCRTCGKPAELVQNPFLRWRHCGQSWVVIGSPMDIANELIDASIPEQKVLSND